mmetsp:Transcript_114397/g.324052  ORF Transcript_114397/g.324052 Transcript_114397/m.324052 type:complete len:283 (+) Transcript_114397:851-1699(+)
MMCPLTFTRGPSPSISSSSSSSSSLREGPAPESQCENLRSASKARTLTAEAAPSAPQGSSFAAQMSPKLPRRGCQPPYVSRTGTPAGARETAAWNDRGVGPESPRGGTDLHFSERSIVSHTSASPFSPSASHSRWACRSERRRQSTALNWFVGLWPPPKKSTLRPIFTATCARPGTSGLDGRPTSGSAPGTTGGPSQAMARGSKTAKSSRSLPSRGTFVPVPPPKTSTFALEEGSSSSGIRTTEWEFRGQGAPGKTPSCRHSKVARSSTSMELVALPFAFPP